MGAQQPPDVVANIISRAGENGGPCWSRADGNIHAPASFSTLLVLNVLGDLGGTREDSGIAAAVEFLFTYQAEDGAFRYSPTSGKLPCISGQALAALGRLGAAEDRRTEISFDRLLHDQWQDGGWRCPTVRLGRSPQTDASNPGATIFVLDAFRFRDPAAAEPLLERGVETLLSHWQTRTPLGPCRFGLGSRFLTVEYPFWRYNLFYYVHVLAHYPAARADRRFREALAALRGHADDRNRMITDAAPRGWQRYGFARHGGVDGAATARWREIEDLTSA